MPSPPRAVLIVGMLMASATLAEAGGRAATESYPNLATLGEQSVPARVAPASPAVLVTAAPVLSRREMRLARRGRRSRYARGRAEWAARDQRSAQIVAVAQPAATVAPALPQPAVAGPTPLAPSQEQAAKTPNELRSSLPPLAGPHETAAPTLTDLIAKHAQQNGVPVELAKAVVRIESRGNPHASNGGALGLMQIKPGTARAAGFSGGASGLFVAETNLHFGMKILGDAYRTSGGDVCRALMLYQSGHLATRMSRANRAYCSRARAVMAGA